MDHLSFLIIVLLTLSHSSFGGVIRISHSVGNSDSGEGSGHNVDSTQVTKAFVSITEVYPSTEDHNSRNLQRLSSIPTSLVPLAVPQKLNDDNIIPEEPERTSKDNPAGLGIIVATTPARNLPLLEAHEQEADKHEPLIIETSGHFYTNEHLDQPTKDIISEETFLEHSQITVDEHLDEDHTPIVFDNFLTGKGKDSPDLGRSPELPFQYSVFNSIINQDLSGPGAPCVLGLGPCVVLTNPNGTNLLWDDMRRTLAFAWELHVFGSASLFALLAGVALLGMAGAHTLLHPLCDALTLANGLLLLTGTLRAVLLLLDPYGTCQILSRPALAALHNVPLQLLLWAQVVLAPVTLRGVKLVLLPVKLQRPWTIGGLAVLHCTPLLVADLLSPTLSPALPLLLQTLSLCWGLPFCIETFTQSLSYMRPFLRSPIPQWGAPQRIENRARRVTAVCALLGILCCSLQMYSLLWLYGVLGNWRRFGWGWWLSQFWARILELAWGFTLLVLGSWIFWTPPKSCSRGDHGQGRGEMSKGVEETSFWGRVLSNIRKGPLRKSEKNWEELMPNNWARYNLSRTGMSNNVMCAYDDQAGTIISDHKPDPVSSSSCDSQAALLWQRVGERECILSVVEFDMRPPSPINLRRSIDNALHYGNFVGGSLFTPPPPSWTHNVGEDIIHSTAATVSAAHVGYRWATDNESTLASPEHFETKELMQSQNSTTDCIAQQYPSTEHNFANKPQEDWPDDDITNL